MARIATAAALVGVVAGFWNVYEYLQVCRGAAVSCSAQQAAPTGIAGEAVLALAVLLILNSVATFIGPTALSYVSAALGALIDAIVILNYTDISTAAFYITAALVTLSVILSALAARRRTGVSEQANPMNLPVFG